MMEHQPVITLNWPDKCPLELHALPPVPSQVEAWGADGGTLIHADCLCAPQLASKPKLVYMDPPFDMGEKFLARVNLANGQRISVPAGFRDSWGADGVDYLQYMYHRLAAIREWMHPDGLLCVHIDQHANSRIRLLLDELFGRKHFVNEIIWSYRSGGGSKKALGHKHDTLYLYRKGEHYSFNPEAVRVPYDAIIASKRQHLFNPDGKVSGDVWDISRPPNHSTEWLGYPTQKPFSLLHRLMSGFSDENDLVADPFCGSGSWLETAHRLGRRWAGLDVGPLAIHTARCRMLQLGSHFGVYGPAYPESSWSYDPAECVVSLRNYQPECLQKHPELTMEQPEPSEWCSLLAEGQMLAGCFHAQSFMLRGGKRVRLAGAPTASTSDALAFDALGYGQRAAL